MRINIYMDVEDDLVDEDNLSGVTEEAYEQITEALMNFGDNFNIEANR